MSKQVSRKSTIVLFLLMVVVALFGWGCDEARFEVPRKKRADGNKYKTRMLAAPMATAAKAPKVAIQAPASPRQLQTRFGHKGAITSLALAPSGGYALTGGARELLRWSLPKGKKQRHQQDLQGTIRQVSFDPAGLRYALLEGRQTISVWSSAGKLLKRTKTPHILTTLRFAPITNQLLALTNKGMLLRYQSTTLQQTQTQQVCPKGTQANGLDFDPLQEWITVGCASGHVWLGKEGKPGRRFDVKSPVRAVAMSPKQPWLAVGTEDAQLRFWRFDLKEGKPTHWAQTQGHFRAITQLSFSADGKRLLSGSDDQHVGVWHVAPGKLKLHKRLRHTGAITGLAWHPTHPTQVVVTDRSGYLRAWDHRGTRLLVREPSSLQGGVVSFSPRADWLATHGDKGFAVWDMKTGHRTTASTVHPHALLALTFAKDGNHLLAVDRDNAVFWDLHHRRYIDVVTPPKGGHISAASLGREWTEVWFGTPRMGVFLWTIAGKRLLYRHTSPRFVTAVAYHPLTRRAAAATLHGKLYRYDMTNRRLLGEIQASKGPITKLAFSPKGDHLYGLSRREALRWTWAQPKKVTRATHSAALTAIHPMRDGKRVLLGSADQKLHWWIPTTPIVAAKITGCHTPIRALDVSTRRPIVAIACQGGAVHMAHLKKHKRISSHIALAGKEWISHNPSFDFISSALALQELLLVGADKSQPLSALQHLLFSPKRLKEHLHAAIK